MSNHQHFLNVATEAAKIGGQILTSRLPQLSSLTIYSKAEFDFVTEVDRESEKAVVSFILKNFPDHRFLAEEGGNSGEQNSDFEWIIDPLDGTTNYIHGVPNFAVSIALRYKESVIAGVVNDPNRNEIFTASQNGGTFLNGKKIYVSKASTLHDSLIATGFPFRSKELSDAYLKMFGSFFDEVRDIRRIGVASMDLAYLAAGRFDGFWEYKLSPWDFAAGVLLVREAGGMINGFGDDENMWKTGNILASNGKIHTAMTKIVRSYHKAQH